MEKKQGKVFIDWKNMKKISIEIDRDGNETVTESKGDKLKEIAKKRAERLGL